MAGRYEFHRGTTESFRVILRRASGAPIPLTSGRSFGDGEFGGGVAGASVAELDFWMAAIATEEVIADYAEAVVLEGLTIPPDDREFNSFDPERQWPKGVVEYRWAGGETDVPGLYRARFRVTTIAADVMFVPNDDDFTLVIN